VAAFEIRPRRATELVDASFQLLRRFYPQMVTVSAIAMAPSVLMRIVMRDQLSDPTTIMANFGPYLGTIGLSTLCIAIADAVLIVAASEGYLEGSVDLARALAVGGRRLLSVILSVVLRYLVIVVPIMVIAVLGAVAVPAMAKSSSAVGVALLVLLLPFGLWFALYAALRTFAVTSAVLLEKLGANSALVRSWGLSRGCTWHIFFSLGLAWTLYAVIVLIVTVIGKMILSPAMVGILGSILIIPVYPLLSIVSTLLYYDLRTRKEGFDLEMMSRDLGVSSAPLPAA
jgi:hypothetical protein